MPLFEVDPEQPVLVQNEHDGDRLPTTAQRVVDGQIDSLLGERIFPVAERSGADDPHLLAIDATGSPVVIEVVADLDESALHTALRRAGAAGRLTRGELARRYAQGPERFAADLETFFDTLPFAGRRPPSVRPGSGARLVVICSSARDDVLDAVDFVRQAGGRTTVLTAGVVHAEDGRRFVDVSPLAIEGSTGEAPGRMTIEPEDAGRRAEAVAAAAEPEAPPVWHAPVSVFDDERERRAELGRRSRRSREDRFAAGTFDTQPFRAFTQDGPAHEEPAPVPPADEPPVDEAPSFEPPVYAPPSYDLPTYDAPPDEPAPFAPVPPDPGPAPFDEDDSDLHALARALGRPTPLVWTRPRRGQRFEATLLVDGYIELADGTRYRSPDSAAVAASGSYTAEGWSVWRLGERGPSLTDAFRSRFS
ncbi:hypothetical protein [Cellulomonas sp. PhB143]|uniref:restriction system modified-DNA reader domain-containing protein n=1 Tax=Cellulomonas sp. PhB143 TaxID=2485186 RepID=UPI000FBA4778|nr:hypothetical protein [Cellulomonas sp. PhB143]ROS78841.1 hypothetical protein EDF32_0750 [Cellulomonas sp. PhB143]